MLADEKFRAVVEGLIAIGLHPSPTRINEILGREQRVKRNMLNGRETVMRAEIMQSRGWKFDDVCRRWRPPGEVES